MFSKKIKKVIKVDGMSCEHCAKKVEMSLKEINDIIKVKVNLKTKEVEITSKVDIDNDIVKNKIEDLDYKVIDIGE